jgi:hypothetical protein
MPFDSQAQIRCDSSEKSKWMKEAGGKRRFSEWARGLLNLAVSTPKNILAPKKSSVPTTSQKNPSHRSDIVYEPEG